MSVDYEARRRRGIIKIVVGLTIFFLVILGTFYLMPSYYG